MSIYTELVSRVIFPLHESLKRHTTVAVLKQMEQTQWWQRERILQIQIKRLREFLVDVNERVPYYRELFAQTGFSPEEVSSLEDLERLPLCDKSVIRANTDGLKADGADGLARFNTGGSSGEPLIFYIGRQRVSHDVAAKWRATRWWGVDIGDPEIVVWGSPIELGAQDRVRYLRDRILRTRLLPAFEMSEERVSGFIREIRSVRPRMLFGYPSAISHIALQAEGQGIRMDDLGIKVAFVTSEKLYDHQREAIQRVFGCPVANGYGGRDAGFIAHQCPEGSMHLTAEDIIVEILDTDGMAVANGEPGEIVVTHMATNEFPFIRYRTGDVGILSNETCNCGRGLPLLKEIYGRATDFVVSQDGTVLHGLALIYVLRDLAAVKQFRIIQEDRDNTLVQIVADTSFNRDNEQIIQTEFKKRLGQGTHVAIEYMDAIENERSGKFRYVISKVVV
jgi:phenylacetate-CoA ligase